MGTAAGLLLAGPPPNHFHRSPDTAGPKCGISLPQRAALSLWHLPVAVQLPLVPRAVTRRYALHWSGCIPLVPKIFFSGSSSLPLSFLPTAPRQVLPGSPHEGGACIQTLAWSLLLKDSHLGKSNIGILVKREVRLGLWICFSKTVILENFS